MSELETIRTEIEKVRAQKRWHEGCQGAWWGLLWASGVWLLGLIVYKVLPIPFAVLGWVGVGCLVLWMGMGLWRYFRPVGLLQIARWVDSQRGLKDRMSTALEMAESDPKSGNPWSRLVLQDAVKEVEKIQPRRLLPFSVPRLAPWIIGVLALAVGLGFVPEYRSQRHQDRVAEKANIKDTGKELAAFVKRELDRRTPELEPTKEAMKTVEELGRELSKGKLNRDAALKELADVSERLKEEAESLKVNSPLEKLRDSLNKGSQSNQHKDLQSKIDSLRKELGAAAGADQEALEDLKQKLEDLKKSAEGSPESMSNAAKAEMAQAMKDLMQEMEKQNLDMDDLMAAMNALEANQFAMMQKSLNDALLDLQKMADLNRDLKQAQAMSEKTGKDLGEQLKFGQAEKAQNTLEKMIRKLQEQGISPQDMEKMVEELKNAESSAKSYEGVLEPLKEAMKQLQKGEKQDGAKSLAEAQAALEKLMQQMGDAEALAAQIKALSRAKMAIGNGMSWGQCSGGSGMPKAGKGGKPGKGVGTWADEENGWLVPEMTDGWDNSGLARPDQDARGLAERGEPQMSDRLIPTKVQGQLSPGAPMPSMPLKGLSIKGTSQATFTEVMQSAQEEAQSALNQGKIPRAYQGAVKDYFDEVQ